MARRIGNRIAPARFIAAAALVLVAAVPAILAANALTDDPWRIATAKGALMAFDIGALFLLVANAGLLKVHDQKVMRSHAAANDANRTALLGITIIASAVVLLAVGLLVEPALGWKSKALVVGTLALAWLAANTVYALHYAHLVVMRGGGIDFPGDQPPGYADFAYFAFTLGMTFQTSDVSISDRQIRGVVTLHCLVAFVFNLGILAFTISMLGG